MSTQAVRLISNLAALAAGIAAWRFVIWIEKRLGCKNDWELIGLGVRKVRSLWQKKGPPQI
jgi:hypothetical protein